jgi:hypothetical protein
MRPEPRESVTQGRRLMNIGYLRLASLAAIPEQRMKSRSDVPNLRPNSPALQTRTRNVRETSLFAGRVVAALVSILFAVTPANAQSQNSGYGVGNVHHGLAVGVAVGVASVAGVGITYLVLHNRGVAEGCIAESGGKRTLIRSRKVAYSLSETGPPLPVGERVKLKGHTSGPASAPSFQVEKLLKDYGRCKP